MTAQNRRWVLASRPNGAPVAADFRLETVPAPVPGDGELLLKTLDLSLDPYMRGRMSDATSYSASLGVGDVIMGATVSRVEQSNNPRFSPGDLVLSMNGWQDYAVSGGKGLGRIDPATPRSWALGVLGMPGFTGWHGLVKIGQPVAGETVVVAAATGPVGAMVGQVAKLRGCRAVGVAGGADKCAYAVEVLGFDACIDHHAANFAHQLKEACPGGVDIYFENVGGKVLAAVIPLLNTNARIPVCGLISQYNATSAPEGPDRAPALMRTILTKHLRVQGFVITNHYDGFKAFTDEVGPALASGKIKVREDVVTGLEAAPEAFMGLLQGKNFGKLVVRVET